MTLLVRFGLVCAIAFFFFEDALDLISVASFTEWYSMGSIAVLLILAAVAGFGMFTSLSHRSSP